MALACGQTPDHSTIAAFITSMKGEIEPLFCNVLLACDEMNLLGGTTFSLDAYIPDVNFRKRDQRFETQSRHKPKNDKFALEDFAYDEKKDVYICPKGKILRLQARRAKTGNWFFRRYAIKDGDCTKCEFADKCLEKPYSKRKSLSIPIEQVPTYHQAMVKKIDTEAGKRKYEKRLGMVEPVFANIRIHKRMDRFTLRGKVKVNIQWLLYCMVHNIEKLAGRGYGLAVK